MSRGRKPQRKTEVIDGVEHIGCTSCHRMLPCNRRHFYFQDRNGVPAPHSWCKSCYRSNRPRFPGPREVREEEARIAAASLVAMAEAGVAAAAFLQLLPPHDRIDLPLVVTP